MNKLNDNINVKQKTYTMERLTLWQRLKPEHKVTLALKYEGRPFQHKALVDALKEECYFTQIRYGDAFDILMACNQDFLGDVFQKSITK